MATEGSSHKDKPQQKPKRIRQREKEKEMEKTQKSPRIFGPVDWASYYGQAEVPSRPIMDILQSPCPFNKGKQVFETHFAFVGMPMINGDFLTVAKWLELHPEDDKQPRFFFCSSPWHIGQPHTDVATLESRLYIVLREIVPGSTDKTPEEQVALLPPHYEVPTMIAEVTKNILVFRKTGKRSNPNHWALCKERTVRTERFDKPDDFSFSGVGFFVGGLRIDSFRGFRDPSVGIGASMIL